MNEPDTEDIRPIVFKDDDGYWKVLRFHPFHDDPFDTWREAYDFAYWHARIRPILVDVIQGMNPVAVS